MTDETRRPDERDPDEYISRLVKQRAVTVFQLAELGERATRTHEKCLTETENADYCHLCWERTSAREEFLRVSLAVLPRWAALVRKVKELEQRWILLAKCSRAYQKLAEESNDTLMAAKWQERAETEEYHARDLAAALKEAGVE